MVELLVWMSMPESHAADRARMSVFWWIGWRKKRAVKRMFFSSLKGLAVACR